MIPKKVMSWSREAKSGQRVGDEWATSEVEGREEGVRGTSRAIRAISRHRVPGVERTAPAENNVYPSLVG